MSFTEKIGSLMQRPNDDLVSKDEIPWWLKYTARGVGSIAGGFGLFFGLFNAITDFITFSVSEAFSGILLSLLGFSVIVFEAPCCCMFVDYVQECSNWMDNRPYWNRSAYYMLGAIITLFLKFGFTKFLACGLIFITGLLYGMMALGKKASPQEMRNNAATVYATNNQQFPPAATSNSNLVEGVQPIVRGVNSHTQTELTKISNSLEEGSTHYRTSDLLDTIGGRSSACCTFSPASVRNFVPVKNETKTTNIYDLTSECHILRTWFQTTDPNMAYVLRKVRNLFRTRGYFCVEMVKAARKT